MQFYISPIGCSTVIQCGRTMAIVAIIVAVCLAVFLAVETSLAYTERNEIKLINNGYVDILVAIGESVPVSDSNRMITSIKFIFEQASLDLFVATYNRTYFRNVTILVPKSWGSSNSYNAATSETFSSANVVVDGPEMETPTTWTFGECGKPGEYIQLPIGYVLASRWTVVKTIGFHGPTFVHEWGHLRWGLRDEYPVSGKKRFYHSNGKVTAVKCGKHMRGSHVDYVTKGECVVDEATGLPTETCYFKPHPGNPGVEASLMFYHNVTEVTTFCDNNTNNLATLHNDEAPNVHNDMCKGRSAWEIMREHDDFRNGNSPAINESQTPTFRIVQAKSKRIVMVLDVSGSMSTESNGVTRIQNLYKISSDYVKNVIPAGYLVGIVTFSDNATTVATLREIDSDSVRDDLVTKLPQSTGGYTAIGKGLLRGVEVLETGQRPASGGVLVLVSDGEENRAPRIAAVKSTLSQKGVVVHTISISDDAEPKLVELAAYTKGKSFFDSGASDSTNLQSAFRTTVKESENDYPGVAPVELLLDTVSVSAMDEVSRSVNIDSSIGRDTTFTFSYTGSTFTLDVLVTSPLGLSYKANGPNGHHDTALKQVIILLYEAEVGEWIVVMKNPGSAATQTQLLVTSKSLSDGTYPIRMRAFLNNQDINFTDSSTLKLIVRAEVKKGYSPVIGAKVEVQVGTLPWKLMKDDGAGVDVLKDDGFYSAVLLKFPRNGYNSMKVRASAKDGNETRLVKGAGNRAFQLFPFNGSDTEIGPTYETVEGLDRTADPGVVYVVNMDLNTDLKDVYPFPPAKVTDLEVTDMSYENKTVTLQWTAVGDYEEQETASSYDIRFSTDIKQLRYSFDNAPQLNDTDIVAGNPNSPLSPSKTETIVTRFPARFNGKTLFFSLKVIHNNTDRVSKVSNIVSAAIVYVPPKYHPTTSEPYTTDDETTIDYTTTWEPTTEPGDTTTDATAILELTTEPEATTKSPITTVKPKTEQHDTSSSSITTNAPPTKTHLGISEKVVFAIKLTFGIGIPVMFLIAIPLMIRNVRSTSNTHGTGRRERHAEGESLSNDYCESPSNEYTELPYSIPRVNRPMGQRYVRDASTFYLPQATWPMESQYSRDASACYLPPAKRPMGPRYVRNTSTCYLPQKNPYQQRQYEDLPHQPRCHNGDSFFDPKPNYYH